MDYNDWVVDTTCDFSDDFVKLFTEKGTDVSGSKTTYQGKQFVVTGSKFVDWKKLREWVLENTKEQAVEDIEIRESWCVALEDGGYQALHRHGVGNLSVVCFLDEQPDTDLAGVLYTLYNDRSNKMIYKQFKPTKGRTVILSGGVWHGVYPSKNTRRSFVVDYKIKGMKHGI